MLFSDVSDLPLPATGRWFWYRFRVQTVGAVGAFLSGDGNGATTAGSDGGLGFAKLLGSGAAIIGNIGMSAVQFEPELFRCMAFNGPEIICRVATGGFEFDDMRLTSYHNSLYTMIANNSVHTNPPLCITDDQLAEAFEIIDRGLETTDQAVTG